MRKLRWILLVPGAIASWYFTFFVGLITYGVVEKALCAPEDMVSGMCSHPDVGRQLDFVIYAFVGLSAMVVVAVAALIAPSQRKIAAWSAFVAGAVVACGFGVGAQVLIEALVALGSGLVAAIATTKTISMRQQESGRTSSAT